MKTYNINEYILRTLRNADLCPAVAIYLDIENPFADSLSVSIFWHAPSLNVGWYPICQIDIGNRTIFHREGSENNEHWNDLLTEAADFLEKWKP